MFKVDTLIDRVLQLAQAEPHRPFVRFLDKELRPRDFSYGDLIQGAGRYARLLDARGVKEGDVVVIILKQTPELLFCFVGALLRGAIPSIFAYPSIKIPPDVYARTLVQLLGVCGTEFLVTYPELGEELAELRGKGPLSSVRWLQSGEDGSFPPEFAFSGSRHSGQIVLLQHSSGTTGLKKGVALSNRSILNQLDHYAKVLELKSGDKIISWLPLYHDMGLIACCLLPMVAGVPLVLMSPFDWVVRPSLVLDAVTREKGTLIWQPNFAYNFLVQNVPDEALSRYDLSSVRAFINCAEPVRAESHRLFFEKFKAAGLSRNQMASCYAMAENTFAVTQSKLGRPLVEEELDGDIFSIENKAVPAHQSSKSRRRMVSSGELLENNKIRIVDGQRRDLPERNVGEIAVQSDSMLSEYYHRPDATRDAIEDGWYFTGDLGYFASGQLFVTGRKKDMIIVAGKNIYPQDVEEVVSALPGVYPGRVVCFGVESPTTGTEEVVILAESEEAVLDGKLRLKLEIAAAVRRELECVANDIVILPHMWLAKSSSGKISRPGNKKRYLEEMQSLK